MLNTSFSVFPTFSSFMRWLHHVLNVFLSYGPDAKEQEMVNKKVEERKR